MPNSATPPRRHASAFIGSVGFFLACVVFGTFEINPSNDTWIGLAAGRQIAELGHVPLTDSLSFTAAGAPWYNQNWLAHRAMYWLYDRLGPDALLYATWLTDIVLFIAVAWACWRRSQSLSLSLIISGLAAFGCRDFLAPRPATAGLACASLLGALITALFDADRPMRKWLAACLAGLLLTLWGNLHGTFVLGYFVLGVCAVCELAAGGRRRLFAGAFVPLASAMLASAVILVVLGPFGWQNFWHPSKVAGSSLWRLIPEWRSAFIHSDADLGRMIRFWCLAGASLAAAIAVAVKVGLQDRRRGGDRTHVPRAIPARTAFDILMFGIMLALALWARRFAPLFLIFAAPAAAAWIANLVANRPASASLVRARVLNAGLFAAALIVGVFAWRLDTLAVAKSPPFANRLERFVRYDNAPDEAFQFLNHNELAANTVVEWADSGALLFHAPRAKVFIDGRAQQVYDEEQFERYLRLFGPALSREQIETMLTDSNAEVVLIRPYDQTGHLWQALESSSRWSLALLSPGRYGIFIRKDSPTMVALRERLEAGREWRPTAPAAMLGRGTLWINTSPPALDRAIECWRNAIAGDPRTGLVAYRWIDAELRRAGRLAELQQYLIAQAQHLSSPQPGLSESDRHSLLRLIEQIRATR